MQKYFGLVLILVSVAYFYWFSATFEHKPKPKGKPQRIASATVASDEILVRLLEDDLSRLLGVSYLADDIRYSNISKLVKSIPHRVGANSESFFKLEPDLVVLALFNRATLRHQLETSGIPTYTMQRFASINDLKYEIFRIAQLVDSTALGEAVIKQFDKQIDKIGTLPRKKDGSRLRILSWSPHGAVMARGTMLDSVITQLGGVNATEQLGLKGWPRVSRENLALLQADWIVAAAEEQERGHVLQLIQEDPAFRGKKPVLDQKIVFIPPRLLNAFSFNILQCMEILKNSIGLVALN